MSKKNKKNEDVEENEASGESEMELDGDSGIIQVDSQTRTEDSSEISQSEDEVIVTDIVTFKSLPPNISGQERKTSCSETSDVLYEHPDDSEFCESLESLPTLRKRPSNNTIESTPKKPCNKLETESHNRMSTSTVEKSEIGGKKNKIIEKTSVDASNNNQVDGSRFLFGCKHKREGEKKKSENVPNAEASQSPGRFTKHKGDNKCHHGDLDDCVATCSSDDGDADVEDNEEDSKTTSGTSQETPPKDKQDESSQNPFQSSIKEIVKRHIKTSSGNKKHSGSSAKDTTTTSRSRQEVCSEKKKASSKTVPRPGPISNNGTTKGKKPANSDKTPKTSSTSKSETSSAELKPGSQITRQKKRRCRVCNKKLDLTAMHCRCGGLFCAKHRYDKEHDCTFDYRAMGAEEIRKNNPKIVAEKVRKI